MTLCSLCGLCTVTAYGVDMHHGKLLSYLNVPAGLGVSGRQCVLLQFFFLFKDSNILG